MKKMKVLVSCLALTLLLGACGASQKQETSEENVSEAVTEAVETVVETAQDTSENEVFVPTGATEIPLIASAITPAEKLEAYEIEEQEIFNQDGYVITVAPEEVTRVLEDDAVLWFTFENSTEQPVLFHMEYAIVNGYYYVVNDDILVSAEDEASVGLGLWPEKLKAIGIDKIETIDFTIQIRDMDKKTVYAETDMIHLETSLASGEEINCMPEESLIWDQDGVRLFAAYEIDEEADELLMTLGLENNTESLAEAEITDFLLGDENVKTDYYYTTETAAGTKTITVFHIPLEEFQGHGPNEIRYVFGVFNLDQGYEYITQFDAVLGE